VGKKFTSYVVTIKDPTQEITVSRRYNDFFELREKMVEAWPGILIPPMPEKQVQASSE
jgi:hypothetical protein